MATTTKDGMQVLKESFNEAESSMDVFVQGGFVATGAGGLNVISTHIVDFSDIPDSASSPFEINPALGDSVKQILFFDTTGETLELRTGAATGSLFIYTAPGQDQPIGVNISNGTRVSIRSAGSAPVAGNVVVTFLGV